MEENSREGGGRKEWRRTVEREMEGGGRTWKEWRRTVEREMEGMEENSREGDGRNGGEQ